jgi:DNA-binding transcriptional LysR family regulator
MERDELSVLRSFVAVAEERSFTRAAVRLGVSTSALSHAIRGLEERLAVRLLSRTTRSVAPTVAGDQLLARLTPAMADIRAALAEVAGFRQRPAGHLRVLVSPLAARLVLGEVLPRFSREYPEIVLELITGDARRDLVADRYDAGIHLGEFIARDMVAVPVSRDFRQAIVGSPEYFETHPRPRLPLELTQHRCINFEYGASGVYRWHFARGKKTATVAVDGPLIVDDVDTMIQAAISGLGLAFAIDAHVSSQLASGTLVRVLEDWCPPFPGYFLYYPSRRHHSAAMTAFVATVRLRR